MNNKKSSYEHECTLHLSFQSQFGDNDVDKDLENDENFENDNDLKNDDNLKNDDDLDNGVPGGDPCVDSGGVGHRLQPVQGNSCQAQGGDVDRNSLQQAEALQHGL